MTWKLVVLGFGTLSACTVAPVEDSADQCLALCGSELELSLPSVEESFQIQLFGEEFNTLNLACPDGIRAGGPAQVEAECTESGVVLTAVNYRFPESLTLSVDSGPEQLLTPAWLDVELCGTLCNQASVEVAP